MPYRFGGDAITRIYPGQSSLSIRAGPIEAGAATENNWWGPALINPIVLGDNAAGFPHAFLRTAHPVNTILGRLEARWIVGGLKESDFFNNSPDNDVRALSAIGIAWERNAASGLTLGFLRAVFSVGTGYSDVPGSAFDVLTNTGHPNARAISDSTMIPGSDQIFSLFARWALPRYGLESYVEWGRAEFPISLRDFLKQPEHSRGYTTGLQWSRPIGTDSRFRVQGEVTNVEQSSTFRFRPIGSFYTSRAVVQGYTNEGQVIGAGIGPGSSAQWLAADFFKGNWQVGATAGRLRFNNDAFFLRGYAHRCGHDVTTYPGIRAAYANSYFRLRADFASATRYNTFFQNLQSCDSPDGEGSDRSNKYLSVTLATFGWWSVAGSDSDPHSRLKVLSNLQGKVGVCAIRQKIAIQVDVHGHSTEDINGPDEAFHLTADRGDRIDRFLECRAHRRPPGGRVENNPPDDFALHFARHESRYSACRAEAVKREHLRRPATGPEVRAEHLTALSVALSQHAVKVGLPLASSS